jgi:hypothetical protein
MRFRDERQNVPAQPTAARNLFHDLRVQRTLIFGFVRIHRLNVDERLLELTADQGQPDERQDIARAIDVVVSLKAGTS